jgi:hypothetical protein
MPPLFYSNAATAAVVAPAMVNNSNSNANRNVNANGGGDQQQRQQQQQQQQPVSQQEALVPLSAVSTPWTLGSTDGSFAVQLAVLEQQRQQAQQHNMHNSTGTTASPSSSEQHNNSNNHHSHNHQLRNSSNNKSPGAAISSVTGEAASKGSVSSSCAGSATSNSFSNQQHGGGGVTGESPAAAAAGHCGAASASVSTAGTGIVSAATNDGESSVQQQQRLHGERMAILGEKRSLFQDRLFRQPSSSVESVLAASCEVMGFDIAEMWLRTGAKTHQLTNSHLRPTALEDSVRKDLVDVYYGEKSSERTHRLSPALCKRAKEANDVVWVTAHTSHGAEALRCSISNVRTAAAVPICHEASNTNITIIFFSIRRYA